MIELYLVGGAVRDKLLGLNPKDLDYVVTGTDSYEQLGTVLKNRGYKIVHRYEDKFTFRAQAPDGLWADFVWARKDGPYQDGEMLSCTPGTLLDDLSRRDFTINAMAQDSRGVISDPHEGQKDLRDRVLRCVGLASRRFTEDPRRMVRALRFSIKYDLLLDRQISACFRNPNLVKPLYSTGPGKYLDSVKEELDKCFRINTTQTLILLDKYPLLTDAFFNKNCLGIHLVTSSKRV